MAFLRYASAKLVEPGIQVSKWEDVQGRASNALKVASKVVFDQYDPKEYLLSHATIIASVDTEDSSLPLGPQMVDGFQVNRKYADRIIKPETSKYVNNNCCVPGTVILMADGTEKPIENVVVGDIVISHTGMARRVVETFKHPFNGQIEVSS